MAVLGHASTMEQPGSRIHVPSQSCREHTGTHQELWDEAIVPG